LLKLGYMLLLAEEELLELLLPLLEEGIEAEGGCVPKLYSEEEDELEGLVE